MGIMADRTHGEAIAVNEAATDTVSEAATEAVNEAVADAVNEAAVAQESPSRPIPQGDEEVELTQDV